MKAVFAISVALTMNLAGVPARSAEVNYSAAYKTCMKAAGLVDLAVAACASEETERWDKKLKDNYKKEMASPDDDEHSIRVKAALKAAQKAWLTFRDKEWKFVYVYHGDGGTMSRRMANLSNMEMTARRATGTPAGVKFSKELDKCIGASEGRDFDMVDCITEEIKRWEKKLNKNYKKLIAALDAIISKNDDAEFHAKMKIALKEAQRAWLIFREKESDYVYYVNGEGTWSRVADNRSFLNITAERATALGKLAIW